MYVCWWNNIDREVPNYSVENLSQCYFVHQKFHMNWGRVESTELQESDVKGRKGTF
jgi:hypothetical protein